MMADPSTFDLAWLVIPAAVALDLLLGDPQGWPHPVRWMGRAIEWMEPISRKRWRNEYFAGTVFAVGLILAAWLAAVAVVQVLTGFHPVLGALAEVTMIYYSLSVRSLRDAALEIHGLLKRGETETARTKLSFIVGRDVERYQDQDIARATVETVAENVVDGVLSPLFFVAIGGAPLGMAYKMVNTLDSMVGYRNERYLRFGRGAARIDDAANYIPSRLSVLVICAAAGWLDPRRSRRAFRTALLEGCRHSSPNAGYPEAAFSGALGIRLGGPNYYHGHLVAKPYIGRRFGPAAANHIINACQLMLIASLIGAGAAWLTGAIIH